MTFLFLFWMGYIPNSFVFSAFVRIFVWHLLGFGLMSHHQARLHRATLFLPLALGCRPSQFGLAVASRPSDDENICCLSSVVNQNSALPRNFFETRPKLLDTKRFAIAAKCESDASRLQRAADFGKRVLTQLVLIVLESSQGIVVAAGEPGEVALVKPQPRSGGSALCGRDHKFVYKPQSLRWQADEIAYL